MAKKDNKKLIKVTLIIILAIIILLNIPSNERSLKVTANLYDKEGNLLDSIKSNPQSVLGIPIFAISGIDNEGQEYQISDTVTSLSSEVDSISLTVTITNTGNAPINISYAASDLSVVVNKNDLVNDVYFRYPYPSSNFPEAFNDYTPSDGYNVIYCVNSDGDLQSYLPGLSNPWLVNKGSKCTMGMTDATYKFLNKPFTNEQEVGRLEVGESLTFETVSYSVSDAPFGSDYAIGLNIIAKGGPQQEEQMFYWRYNKIPEMVYQPKANSIFSPSPQSYIGCPICAVDQIDDEVWSCWSGGYIVGATARLEFYINYTKPSGAYLAKWEIAGGAVPDIYNLTIPMGCFNRPNLELKVDGGVRIASWHCYDGSQWIHLKDTSFGAGLACEQSMWWGI